MEPLLILLAALLAVCVYAAVLAFRAWDARYLSNPQNSFWKSSVRFGADLAQATSVLACYSLCFGTNLSEAAKAFLAVWNGLAELCIGLAGMCLAIVLIPCKMLLDLFRFLILSLGLVLLDLLGHLILSLRDSVFSFFTSMFLGLTGLCAALVGLAAMFTWLARLYDPLVKSIIALLWAIVALLFTLLSTACALVYGLCGVIRDAYKLLARRSPTITPLEPPGHHIRRSDIIW